jgi:ribosomal protein S18 acetylase RimI-like enzyme
VSGPLNILELDSTHDRSTFTCGVPMLDQYLQTKASQDVKRHVAKVWVLVDDQARILGYYTLSSHGIALTDLPDRVQKKLPRYPMVPVVRVGRLAISAAHQGQGLGALLLADALARIIAMPIGVFALVVDAKNLNAATFYRKNGFIPFLNDPLMLFLRIDTASQA